MSITIEKDVLVTGIFKQGDIRDPIGLWGGTTSINSDATGGKIRTSFRVDNEDAFLSGVFSIYSANVIQVTGLAATQNILFGINSNWPNIDQTPGITPYNGFIRATLSGEDAFSPVAAVFPQLVGSLDRFRLIFDPRHIAPQNMLLCQFEMVNVNAKSYLWSVYGYFWDRSVLDAPGGPRHPGSS